MSERLTDAELANYDKPARHETDVIGGGVVIVEAHDWLAVSAELRAHRASALTSEDCDLIAMIQHKAQYWDGVFADDARALLARLAGGAK